MTTYKAKINGRKQKFRIVGKNETIKENFLQYLPACNMYGVKRTDFTPNEVIDYVNKGAFSETRCVGESTAEHLARIYIEIVNF